MLIKDKILNLIEKLNKWSNEYYNKSNTLVSDEVYDAKYLELVELEKQNPEYIFSNSPTQKVGTKISDKFKKEIHENKMFSLGNAFNRNDLLSFDKQIKSLLASDRDIEYTTEYKIDGLSISLIYEDGLLKKAITRGDGVVGENVTHNVLEIRDVPKKISYKTKIEFRGEIFLTHEAFNKMNFNSDKKFQNPRNAASGSIRNLNSNITRERNLSSFIYTIPNPLSHGIKTQYDVIQFIKTQGFNVSSINNVSKDINDSIKEIEKLEKNRLNLNYDVDGIVLKVNQNVLHDEIGYTVKAPKYMIAYKFPSEKVQTELLDIFPTIGRTGKVTYNAKLYPVRIAGSTISAATLHNADYIKEIGVNIGDIVKVKKAGDIIPKVIECAKKINNSIWKKSTFCPNCSSKLVINNGEVDQYCINKDCSAILIASLEHFVSRTAMNIEGLSTELLLKFIDANLIKKSKDIYLLHRRKDEILNMNGFKEKSVSKLLKAIENSKNVTLDKFLFSLGIRHVGAKTSSVLSKRFNTIEKLKKASNSEILKIKDIGEKTAFSLIDFFRNDENIKEINELVDCGIKIKHVAENKSSLFEGLIFVITGTLKNSRLFYKKIIEENNGNISNSISKNTSYVLVGNNPGTKFEKAKALKVKIINEEEFLEMVGKNE